MMACDDSMLKSIEESMRSHNLRPARICVGLFAMTAHLMNRIASDNSLKQQDLIIVTWLDQSLCVIRQQNGQWQDLRCRSGLQPGDEATVAQMLRPFIESAAASTRVLLMEDRKQGTFSQSHLSHFGNLSVTDVTDEQTLSKRVFTLYRLRFLPNQRKPKELPNGSRARAPFSRSRLWSAEVWEKTRRLQNYL